MNEFPNTRACCVVFADGSTHWTKSNDEIHQLIEEFKTLNPELKHLFPDGAFFVSTAIIDLTPEAHARIFNEKSLDADPVKA